MKLKNILAALLFTALLFLISIYLQAQHYIPASRTFDLKEGDIRRSMPEDLQNGFCQTVAGKTMIPTTKDVHYKISSRLELITFTLGDIPVILRKSIDITLNL